MTQKWTDNDLRKYKVAGIMPDLYLQLSRCILPCRQSDTFIYIALGETLAKSVCRLLLWLHLYHLKLSLDRLAWWIGLSKRLGRWPGPGLRHCLPPSTKMAPPPPWARVPKSNAFDALNPLWRFSLPTCMTIIGKLAKPHSPAGRKKAIRSALPDACSQGVLFL
eukprot:scaffold369995_cov30-Prasinocladus_malaysianus.AAC.1